MKCLQLMHNRYSVSVQLKECPYVLRRKFLRLNSKLLFCQKLHKGCPVSYAKFQHNTPRGSAAIAENS